MSAPGGVPHRTMGQFCGHVCQYVRFWPDHAAITAELIAHLEDHRDALLEHHPDWTPSQAEYTAVAAMGDAEELGRWLDSVHNPLLGWLQLWFCRVMTLVWAVTLLLLLFRAGPLLSGLAAPVPDLDIPAGHTVQLSADGSAWEGRGCTFSVPQAAENWYGDSRSVVCLLKVTHPNPWRRDPEFDGWLWAEDDLGGWYPSWGHHDQYDLLGSMVKCKVTTVAEYPFVTYYQVRVHSVDPAAARLTLRFDRYGEDVLWLTIPLEGGEHHG